ncbi:MAG: TlpA family protein disulfide reductase [Armatimonadetes bacterium]|nr:TlpA family protein disulfide reductase [Armatimonadota bacterium]
MKFIARTGLLATALLCCHLAWAIPFPGTKADNFSLKDLEGNPVILRQFQSKVPVLYNVWSSACPFCQKQVPQVEKLAVKYQGKLIVINSNIDLRPWQLKAYVKQHNLRQGKVVLDTDKTVAQAYSVMATPTAYLIDKKGMIQAIYAGYAKGDEKAMDQDIRTLLKTGKVPARKVTLKGGCGL